MAKVVRKYMPGGAFEDTDKTLSLEALQKGVDGWVEIVHMAPQGVNIDIACDEDGKMKGGRVLCRIFGYNEFVGNIYVGKFTSRGLEPVDVALIKKLEKLQPR